MKKSLLSLLFLGLFVTLPSNADVTVEELTDAEYLINSGYSQLTAEDVFMLKNRVSGKSIEPLYEKSQNKFVRVFKRFHAYIDPSIDNHEERLHHDIKPSPSVSDL